MEENVSHLIPDWCPLLGAPPLEPKGHYHRYSVSHSKGQIRTGEISRWTRLEGTDQDEFVKLLSLTLPFFKKRGSGLKRGVSTF